MTSTLLPKSADAATVGVAQPVLRARPESDGPGRFALEVFVDLTFRALGWTWHWSLEPDAEDEAPEFEAYQDAGVTSSTAVGFARAEIPWEDAGSARQFEPEDRRRP